VIPTKNSINEGTVEPPITRTIFSVL